MKTAAQLIEDKKHKENIFSRTLKVLKIEEGFNKAKVKASIF